VLTELSNSNGSGYIVCQGFTNFPKIFEKLQNSKRQKNVPYWNPTNIRSRGKQVSRSGQPGAWLVCKSSART